MDDEHEFNPVLGMALAQTNIIMETDDIRPIPSQYDIGPGVMAVISGSMSSDSETVTVVKVLDPEEYKEQFPDYEDRLMNSYVLGRYHEAGPFTVPEGTVGWLSRVSLVELSEENYNEILGYIREDTFPKVPPTWLSAALDAFQVALAAVSPDTIPSPIACKNCGEYKVAMCIEHVVSLVTETGVIVKDGVEKVLPIGEVQHVCMSRAKLVCSSCAWHADLETKKIHAGNNNSIRSLLGHGH